jgi:hypothetical protein
MQLLLSMGRSSPWPVPKRLEHACVLLLYVGELTYSTGPRQYIWPPCRHGTARACRAGAALLRASPCRRAYLCRAVGQAISPRHGTRAEYSWRAAHGPAGLISITIIQLSNNKEWSYIHMEIR